MEEEQAKAQDLPTDLGSQVGGSFTRWARFFQQYGPAFLIVVAVLTHFVMLSNSANVRFDGLYQEMNDRFDRLDDQISALDTTMEGRFDRAESKADERYDRMGAEADARYERYDHRADERFDRLLEIVRHYEGRISGLESVLRTRPAE